MVVHLQKLWKIILLLFACVIFGHIWGVYLGMNTTVTVGRPQNFLLDLFYFNSEKNITALFSSYLFIIIALFFHDLAATFSDQKKGWMWLRNIAVYLACDEWFAIHDSVLNVYGLGPFDIPYWVWVYAVLCSFILIRLIPFIRFIPAYLFRFLVAGAAVFIGGAALMEVVTYQSQHFFSIFFQIGLFFEDGLEMSGLLITIYGLISYFRSRNISEVRFPKVFCYLVLFIGLIDFAVSFYLYR